MVKILLLIFLLINTIALPQKDVNISTYLADIERGKADEVRKIIPRLQKESPGAPSLIYLEGLVTTEGTAASRLYSLVADKYPDCSYADDALYRLYNYYAAINNSQLADKYTQRLKKEYPSSPYLNLLPEDIKENFTKENEYKFTIQAGAFSNSINAENLRKKLVRDGYYSVVKNKNAGGTNFRIVYAGRFKSRSEAESFQMVLNKMYGLKGIITKYQE